MSCARQDYRPDQPNLDIGATALSDLAQIVYAVSMKKRIIPLMTLIFMVFFPGMMHATDTGNRTFGYHPVEGAGVYPGITIYFLKKGCALSLPSGLKTNKADYWVALYQQNSPSSTAGFVFTAATANQNHYLQNKGLYHFAVQKAGICAADIEEISCMILVDMGAEANRITVPLSCSKAEGKPGICNRKNASSRVKILNLSKSNG